MDCKKLVAVNDQSNYSAFLEEAVVLVRKVLKIECPLLHANCLNSETNVDLYLLPFFEGETFELVKKTGVPIIGPAAISFLLKHEVLLPRRLKKGQHMFSVSLQKTRVCCSNIDKDTREKLYQQVIAMGGTVSTTLTSEVTHLVVDEVGSLKYQCAVKLGIPIMSPSWITFLWEKSKSQVIENDATVMTEYKCLPFRGCTICVTGLDAAQRSDIQVLTAKYGGTYSGDLVMDKCTHLILDQASGNKYEHARKWKIPCIKSAWFYECIKKGVCLELAEFQHSTTAAPANDVSYRPVLEETRDCNTTAGRNDTTVLSQLNTTDLDIPLSQNKGYLDGCRIYVSGFTSAEQDKIKKLINHGGAMRLDVLSERVTHIVSKVKTLKEVEVLNGMQPEAAVVSVDWLIKSMQEGAQQSEDVYTLLPTSSGEDPHDPLPSFRQVKTEKPDASNAILDQYRSSTTTGDTTLNNTTLTTADLTKSARDVTLVTRDVTLATRDNATSSTSSEQSANTTSSNTTALVNSTKSASDSTMIQKSDLFKGFRFEILADTIQAKIKRLVQQQIIAHGGCLRNDNVDFVVGDPFKTKETSHTNSTFVTYMWIQRCIQGGKILSVGDNLLFTPRNIPQDCNVLQGTVICYTQFSGFELSHICKLIETLGGTHQGTFTNRAIAATSSQPCTHLLYQRYEGDSKKVLASFKWKLPCVHITWLYKCYDTLSLVDVTPYLYDKEPPGKRDKDQAAASSTEALGNAASKLSEKIPVETPAVTITRSGSILKHDEEGFVTPMKLKPKSVINVEPALEALESPAPALDTTVSSLETVYKRNIAAALRKTAAPPPSTKILSGVTLVVKQSKNIEVPAAEIKAMARRNGAAVRTYIDRACTHVICSLKDVREPNMEEAAKRGVKAVSCYWVSACDEAKERLPEAEFPPGFDPKRSLNISAVEDVQVPAVEIDNTQQFPELNPPPPAPDMDNPHSLDANLQKEIKMLERITSSEETSSGFVAPGTPRSRGSSKRTTFRKIEKIDYPGEDLMTQPHSTVTYEDGQETREAILAGEEGPSSRVVSKAPLDTRGSVDTRSEPVDLSRKFDIPDDTLNNSNLPNVSLAPHSSSTPNAKSDVKEVPKLSESEVKELIKDFDSTDIDISSDGDLEKALDSPPVQRYFLFTGMNDIEKKEFGSIAHSFGGIVLASSTFDTRCTHLIATKPNRNEKFISAVGSGIWVLHPTYLTACKEGGRWLEEKQYTWDKFSADLKGITKSLADSSCRWSGRKAFTGWNVMLCISSHKTKNIKGVIECGGGKVSQYQAPYKVLSGLTHALVETAMNPKPDVPISALLEAGVHCLKLEYIPEYLTHGADPKVRDEHILPAAREIMTSSKISHISKRSLPDTSLTSTPSKRHKT